MEMDLNAAPEAAAAAAAATTIAEEEEQEDSVPEEEEEEEEEEVAAVAAVASQQQQLPRSPTAPSAPPPEQFSSMQQESCSNGISSYDDEEIERSRHFAQALKELKSLRPQLYSAAEYCESSYLYSDQKQVVLDNLKEYSVKALVNAVDHLGTVAYKFNDLLSHQSSEISTTELRAASLAQRMRSCQEHSDREGLKQQSLAKPMPVHHKHYVLPEPYPLVEEDNTTILRERFDSSQVRSKPRQTKESNTTVEPQLSTPPPLSKDPSPSSDIAGSSESNPAAWHFASSASSVANTAPSNGQQPATSAAVGQRTPPPASGAKVLETSLPKGSFLTSSLYNAKSMPKTTEAGSGGGLSSSSKYPDSAKVSATRSGSFTPLKTAPATAQTKAGPLSRSSTMLPETGSSKESRPRSKSLLRSLLSRRKP